MNETIKALAVIQQKLKAPKNQRNKFANFNYRNCEDILEALKPFLGEGVILLSDCIREIGGNLYVESVATFTLGIAEQEIKASAYAREPAEKKGMDSAQITCATSSYARKYALNGLLAIDDSKDSDSGSGAGNQSKPTEPTISNNQVGSLDMLFQTVGCSDEEISTAIKWASDGEAKNLG